MLPHTLILALSLPQLWGKRASEPCCGSSYGKALVPWERMLPANLSPANTRASKRGGGSSPVWALGWLVSPTPLLQPCERSWARRPPAKSCLDSQPTGAVRNVFLILVPRLCLFFIYLFIFFFEWGQVSKNPASSWILIRFITAETWRELLFFFFLKEPVFCHHFLLLC